MGRRLRRRSNGALSHGTDESRPLGEAPGLLLDAAACRDAVALPTLMVERRWSSQFHFASGATILGITGAIAWMSTPATPMQNAWFVTGCWSWAATSSLFDRPTRPGQMIYPTYPKMEQP
jgi:hypothetical protein